MANFCYKAISAKGKTVRGLVEADTERQAIASVREKLSLIHISEPTRPY